ncbi:MAG TPA: asparagine synthase (glutamine-hydrolyzing) [Chloroflexia bacterium]|nr:asparagine synthase (glutamine-hydrolyzing) [Chloroflexia bacterium]
MCGIFGIWHTDGRQVDLHALRRGVASLRHRGPDDEGYLLVDTRAGRTVLAGGEHTRPELGLPPVEHFAGVIGERFDFALGFRRLSILDLSPAGHQPMCSHDGRLWLVFNGEVYNYIELRRELESRGHTFKTGTDSEVVLAAYRQWGPECLSRFNGMWALALWDGESRSLFLARDRFGVKPLYTVTSRPGTFAFSSEIKALVASGTVPFSPRPEAVAGYVAEGRFPGHRRGETFFDGVQELPGGHYATVDRAGRRAKRFWWLPVETAREADPVSAVAEYRGLFTDSVRLRLRADVPVGTCLSGGLDSSSIVAVAGHLMQTEHAVSLERLGDHQQTFSAVYDERGRWNEREYIDRVLEHTGAAGNFTYPTLDRMLTDLDRLVWHQDEPFQSTSIFAQWCVMSLARERGVTVLLDGQGADEVLAGYRPYNVWLGHLIMAGKLLQAAREAREMHDVGGVSTLPLLARAMAPQLPSVVLRQLRKSRVSRAVSGSALNSDLAGLYEHAQSASGEAYEDLRDLNEHLARLLLEDSLPNLLRYEDRNSMAFSIEARVPYLDYRLVEYVFTMAPHLRIHQGWTKWLHRAAFVDMLPPEIVWRRDKVGFETPEQRWFREGKAQLLDLLSSGEGAEYLDLDHVRHEAPLLIERGEIARVWRWINLVRWLGLFRSTAASAARLEPAAVTLS